jgi:hypothetical protein
MFDRLKRVLVESFIGTVGLGYLLAEAVLYFVRVFESPVAAWATRKLYRGLVLDSTFFSGTPLRAAAPPAVGFVLLLLVWYLLLRWLYFTPIEKEKSAPNPEQPA